MNAGLTKRDTSVIKGFAILCIVFHNFFHWLYPAPGENEFDFAATRVMELFHLIAQQPGDVIRLLFAYLGHYGVQLFIFVSGFGLTVAMLNRQRSWSSFVLARLKKLYPLLLTGLLVWLPATVLIKMEWPGGTVWTEIGYKLLFVHTLIPYSGLSVNGPWWFFGLIFQLYLLFPLLFSWLRRWGWKAFLAVCGLSYGVVFLFLYGFDAPYDSMVMMNAPGHLPEFCLGVALASRKDRKLGWGWVLPAVAVFCLGNVYCFFYPFTFLALTVMALLAYQGLKRLSLPKRLISRPLAYFGGISMALFVVHGFFREPLLTFALTMDSSWGHLLSGLIYLLVVWGVAIGAKHLYDRLYRLTDRLVPETSESVLKLSNGLCQWLKLCVFLLLGMLVVRLFFYLQVHFRIEVEALQFVNIAKGSIFDFYLACHVAVWLLLPFMLFHWFFPKTTYRVGLGLMFAYLVVAASLTEYFCNLFMPLDHVVLMYSPSELKDTVTSSTSFTAAPFLLLLVTLAVMVLVWRALRRIKLGKVISLVLLVVALAVAITIPYKQVIREERYYQDHASFCLAVNQPSYSYIKITDYLRKTRHPEEAHIVTVDESSYPFFRKADDPDVLSPFIEPTSDSLPPNFVFIIVESLGQRLTGVDQPEMSFTPFIDSLKHEGLYWEHCLSTSERTFGVLPSMFASAPYGKYGFYMTSIPMPNHNSLLRDMKRNGYETRYYYGAADEFSRFDIFLKANRLDYIYFPGVEQMDSTHFEKLNEFQRWGMDDREVVAHVKEYCQKHPSVRPRADIIMTLTTHEPFFFEEIEPYEEQVKTMLEAHPELSKKERKNIEKNLNIFACFLYMDDCVRDLMAFYRTLPEYENTVFVITGDHRMGPLRFKNPLSQFTVPLLVYSPLIKHPRSMEAVVSHLDITPTINAWLSANYDYEIHEDCHWIGSSLDTTLAYENTHWQAFMLNNRDVVDYIHGDYMISNNRLYRIDEELLSHPLDDDSILARMRLELDTFNALSQFAVMNDHLMPALFGTEALCNYEHDEEQVLDSTMLYGRLFEPLLMTTDKADLMLDIAFDFQNLDPGRDLPVVGTELGSYLVMLPLDSADGHFHQHVSILNEESKDKLLKVYLFNPHNSIIKYGNIKINVAVAKE